jgi:hypothetical protein
VLPLTAPDELADFFARNHLPQTAPEPVKELA